MFNINPQGMQTLEQYQDKAKLMYNIVNNYENYESGEMYEIDEVVS